jgi:RNA polymerase sigma-70 factor (ECF subfamily)
MLVLNSAMLVFTGGMLEWALRQRHRIDPRYLERPERGLFNWLYFNPFAARRVPTSAFHFLALLAHAALIDRILLGFERDPDRRQDLRQDVALALVRAAPGWRGDCSARTFVARITHNVCVSHVRGARRQPAGAPLDETLPSAEELPDAAQRRDLGRRLEAAVAALPEGLRAVTLLQLEGLSTEEIAGTLGIAQGAVFTRLTRARAALREMMEAAA